MTTITGLCNNMDRLKLVLKLLQEHNLQLSPAKCKFLQSVKFLGHFVPQDEMDTNPDKLWAERVMR